MGLINWWKNRKNRKEEKREDRVQATGNRGGLVKTPSSRPISGGRGGYAPSRNVIGSRNDREIDNDVIGADDIIASAIVFNAITSDTPSYESSSCDCGCDCGGD